MATTPNQVGASKTGNNSPEIGFAEMFDTVPASATDDTTLLPAVLAGLRALINRSSETGPKE